MTSADGSVERVRIPGMRQRVGPFELLERLGRGGMAVVYKARHPDFEEAVAVKVANQKVIDDIDLSKRFEGEYTLGMTLSHPNIVKTLAHGMDEDVPYLVMEYVPGCDLDKYILHNGTLSEEKSISIFSQVMDALEFMHEKNLVHRDIKPANILVEPSGRVKLADFGLIKDTDAKDQLTRSGMGLGTLDYAAPEQYENAANVDYRCDIYSLAVALYVSLTGIFPFGRATPMSTLLRKVKFEFAPLSQVLFEVGTAFDQAITRAMHPDPAMRQASIADLRSEIKGKLTEGRPPLTPVLPEPYRPESRDRRKHQRSPLTVNGIKVAHFKSEVPPVEADTTNISVHGMCIMASRAFSIGSILAVSFPTSANKRLLRLRVCWVRQTVDRRWLMGGAFVSELNEDELKMLTRNELPETEFVQCTGARLRLYEQLRGC